MTPETLGPIASYMLSAYFDTAIYSADFKARHDGHPPTTMAKVHNLRASLQAQILNEQHFELSPEYADFGRVQITHPEDGRQYLLRSDRACQIEEARNQRVLFASSKYLISPVVLLVYAFRREGLSLGVCSTRKQTGRTHLVAREPVAFVGIWPYESDGTDGPAGFDQGGIDAFGELGETDLFDEESGE